MVLINVMSRAIFKYHHQRNVESAVVDRTRQIFHTETGVKADDSIGTSKISITIVDKRLAVFWRTVYESEENAMGELAGRIGHDFSC